MCPLSRTAHAFGRIKPVLASDREREATVLRLRAAHLEGRIETEEFEDRVGRAEAARTRAELEAIEADLPERSGVAVEPTCGVPWFPGRRHFAERKILEAPRDEVREAALTFLVAPLERNGYQLHQEASDVLVFLNPHRGERIMARFRDLGDRRTLVVVHGVAPLGVRRAFARLDE
jgi:Domain of unknown function (DUF1707)